MARQMKDSGIEWIGEIPTEWHSIKVKYTSWLKGRIGWDGLKSTEYTEEGPYLITGTDFSKGMINWKTCVHISEKRFEEDVDIHIQENDLLITKDGTVGKVAIAKYCPPKVSLNSGVLLIRNLSHFKYDAKYMYFVLLSDVFWRWYQLSQTGQSTIKHLYQEQFYNFEYPFPPLAEQHRIADFLDRKCAEIDAVIERTKATIEEYKKLKQAVITEAVTKGVRGARKMKDSGIEWIGEIPEEWIMRKLKSFSCIISKGATPKDIAKEVGSSYPIRFLKSENIVDNQLTLNPEFYISSDVHNGELKRSALSCDDILFVIAGASIGKVALMDAALLPANTNQAVSFVRVSKEYVNVKRFIWYVLQSKIMKTYISLFAVQSAQPNMSMEDLGDFRMPFTQSNDEITEITLYLDRQCSELDTLITKKTALLTELETYKKSLIYEYVTGKKEV